MTAVERVQLDVAPTQALTERLSHVVRSLVRVRPARWFVLVCTGLSPVLLVGGWLIADPLQPASYSPVRQTVSVLAGYGGTDRWIVTSALFVIGACYFVAATGLTELPVSARAGLLITGVAAVGIAVFPEPADGTTWQHAAATAIGAVAIAVWPALVGRRDRFSSALLGVRASAAVTVVFGALLAWFALSAWGVGGALGLAERVGASVQICWPFVVAIALRRGRSPSGGDQMLKRWAPSMRMTSPLR